MGDILESMISQELNEKTFFFHGSLTRSQRDKIVSDFQGNPETRIMVVSLKAGGTGLNLTAAARVIHYDLWWNPAVETQATDRVYRIGQHRNVTVHRLITLGTFEEKIDDMIKQKKELSELTVSVGESWITELPERELKKIFSLR
ncbi:MAG: SWF/SNF helicase family protein [Ignavibacteria bacterium]|jgi:SNF2 family DNA or RNA helicase|nr:SWF/SNF helicase family protein [Ignavibacteria bacterium]MCU7520799.1 SWF/SNF helicase family protein [Ignavibacteria bacterium]